METDEIKELPAFADLVSGTFETVPSQESSTVRVFLSSTFTGNYFYVCLLHT